MNNKGVREVAKGVLKKRIKEIQSSIKSDDFEYMFQYVIPFASQEFLWEVDVDDISDFANWLSEEGREKILQEFISKIPYEEEIRLIFAATSPALFCSRLLVDQYIDVLNQMNSRSIKKLFQELNEEGKEELILCLQVDTLEAFITYMSGDCINMQELSDLLLRMPLEDFEKLVFAVSYEALNVLIFSASDPTTFCKCLTDEMFSGALNQMSAVQIYQLYEEADIDRRVELIVRLSNEKFSELIEEFCIQPEKFEKLVNTIFEQGEIQSRFYAIIAGLEQSIQAEIVRNAGVLYQNSIFEIVWGPKLLDKFSELEIIQLMLKAAKEMREEIFKELAEGDYTYCWREVGVDKQVEFLQMLNSENFPIWEVFTCEDFMTCFLAVDTPDRETLVFEILLNTECQWIKKFYDGLDKATRVEILEMAFSSDQSNEKYAAQRIVLESQLRSILSDRQELETYEKVFLKCFEEKK